MPADIVGYGGWLAAAGDRLPRGRPVRRAVRRPGAAARRGRAQRARPGRHPPARPRLRDRRQAARLRPAAADLDDARRAAVRRDAGAVLRDHRVLQRFTYTIGLAAIVLLLLPMVPVIGATINGARIWIHLGPFSFQPGEVAKVLLVVAFAGYLVLHRDALALAGPPRAVRRPAPRPRPRPDPGDVADQPRHPGLPARPRLQPAVLRPVPGHALRRHRATGLAGRRWRAVPGRRVRWPYQLFGHVAEPRRHLARTRCTTTTTTHGAQSFQLVEAMFGMAWGGLIGRGFGDGSPERVPYAESDFIVGSIGEELGPDRGDRGGPALRPDRRAGAARGAGLPRRLRQAGGGRPRRRLRPAGLRRHRRRHPA